MKKKMLIKIFILIYGDNTVGQLKKLRKPGLILKLTKIVILEYHWMVSYISEAKTCNYRPRLSHDGFGLWWQSPIYVASFSDHSGKFVERQFKWIGQTTNGPSKEAEQSWRHGSKRSVNYLTFYYLDRRPYKLNSPILPLNKWYNHF